MEITFQGLDQLIQVISRASTPMWITIIGVFVPILISIIIFLQSLTQNRKNIQLQKQIEQNNEELQKKLSEHDERIQMRSEFLKIYDDLCSAQSVIGCIHGQIHIIFSNFTVVNNTTVPIKLVNDVNNATRTICQSVNRAKLLLPSADEGSRKMLENIYLKFCELQSKINNYYNSGYAHSTCDNAWNYITSSCGITRYDYYTLIRNSAAYDSFLRLCVNDSINEIEHIIEDILPLFDYDKFDRYFEPYLQMGRLEGKYGGNQ